jgi:hypothetical protein
MDAPTGSLIAYSTAPGDVAADGPERNGIFTKHLIQHMKTPNLSIEQVLKQVRIDVASQTNGRQIPWEASSLMGDFYFNTEKDAIKNEKTEKSKILSESGTETQVAAISDDNKRNIEPWTGIWDLKYYHGGGLRFVLKQVGNEVNSTDDSCCEFSGKIEGNTLKGWIVFDDYERLRCSLKISEDNKSFNGTIKVSHWSGKVSSFWGKRKK